MSDQYAEQANRSARSYFQARQAIGEIDWNRMLTRFLTDTLNQVMPDQWEWRAEQLQACQPAAGDYRGNSTTAELQTRTERVTAQATACRRHAALLRCNNDTNLDLHAETIRLEAQ